MKTDPVFPEHQRFQLATVTMAVSGIPRMVAWFLGAVLGSIVSGFIQGWRDAA